jgi:hypothetical protein
MRSLKVALVAFLFAATAASPAGAAELTTQKSADRGVTVEVTPRNLSAGASTWDFKVVLDTHSGELNDDLVKTATLLDNKGGRHLPVQWEGPGPGGHHREGVLQFRPISPTPQAIELKITRPGEPNPRSFRWQLK